MKPIEPTFAGNRDQTGFTFTLLKRQGQVALFEKTKPEWQSKRKLYEVVILQQCPEKRWPDGRTTPAHEKLPKPEEWGVLAWSPYTLESAQEKFDAVVASQKK